MAVEHEGDTLLLALGSGSTPHREQVVLVRGWASGSPDVALVHVPQLYEALRAERAFSGSELNVEGAVVDGDRLRLFGRGNGAPRNDVLPVNATCDLDWTMLLARPARSGSRPAPPPVDAVRYDLGMLDGVPLWTARGGSSRARWRESS